MEFAAKLTDFARLDAKRTSAGNTDDNSEQR
jgi:hypothetical protein